MITARPLRTCPVCGKKELKRLIGTGAGIIFKGSGFYQTDYRSESYKKAEKSEKSSAEKKPATESKEPKPVKKDKSTPTEKK
jgi:predicted nucleic acid-binding Zn ribbon protein